MAISVGGKEENGFAMLPTALVRLEFNGCISLPLRALCDTGAQASLIEDNVVQKLHWPTQQCNVRFNGIDGVCDRAITRKLVCKVLSRFDEEPLFTVELMILPRGLDMWLPQNPVEDLIVPLSVADSLADPGACVPSPVNIILGVSFWAMVIRDGGFIGSGGVAFQPSRIGWLVFGGGGLCANDYDHLMMKPVVERDYGEQTDALLRRFWEVEEVSTTRTRTLEQEQCEEIFMRTHRRLADGRYQVNIPLRDDLSRLGSSRAIALHRFHQLERRFRREPGLLEQYTTAINTLLDSNQMRLADRPPSSPCYHIPHHAVLTKFRIVNDATCKTDLGMSLNEAQLVGEKLQDDLAVLVMRFRCHPVAITADIRKMFLQVRVNPDQWDLQRIFWRPDPNGDIKEYWMTVVTFGMASAPHCAVRTMIQSARDSKAQFPMGAEAIEHDYYMDDCLTGARSDVEARRLCHEMDSILRSCGFILDKWRSNRQNVVPQCSSANTTSEVLEISELNDTTVLGLRWLPRSDELMFKFQPPPLLALNEATKRRLLSNIAKLFDPNGYIGPVVIAAKIIMQKIWSSGIGWDEKVPEDIFREWQEYQQQLPLVSEIRLPRWLGIGDNLNVTLHGFADASMMAYGAVMYARVESAVNITTILIAAKSRVAPLKTLTMPRLELCAAQILGELVEVFKVTSRMTKTFLWSDSQIVLAWLKKDAATLKIFVNNRVQKIQQLTAEAEWHYVPSSDNPADLISRGVSVAELQSSKLWWHGPEWLVRPMFHWPDAKTGLSMESKAAMEKEERADVTNYNVKTRSVQKQLMVMSISVQGVDLLARSSSAHALFRQTAWMFRFIHNARAGQRRTGPLLNKELSAAQEFWLRKEQSIYYAKEINAIVQTGYTGLDSSSPIAGFNPQIDNKGVLRMCGRLDRLMASNQCGRPALLPDVSLLAKLLIREAHERTLHGGPRLMTAYLRQRFWITNLRRAIRTNNSRCIVCVRQRQQVCNQLMGELPSDRVEPYRPFKRAGVDYAGPFMVKARGGRCSVMEKKYVAVFVCMVTKAVHLELAESLSTEDFVQAFLNFTSIRGACERIWSDNGRNFEGAATELKEMLRSWNDTDMGGRLQIYGTEWRFITPYAPHQGGLWEAAVKSMKFHLHRIVGSHRLTGGEFRSVLNQIAAVMNSRPISALSDDPEDLLFLTPAHFLIGEPIVQPFGLKVTNIPANNLNLLHQRQKMVQAFWKVWTRDYLNELQQRPKWQKVQPNLKVGDLVIVKEENIPPTMWKSARILEVYPGKDGLVRNVSIRTATSDWVPGKVETRKKMKKRSLRKPVQKLCRLPVDDIEAERSRGQNVGADV